MEPDSPEGGEATGAADTPRAHSARCAEHSAPALGPCERCGTFVCERCGHREREHLRCHRCGPPPVERPPPGMLAALILAAVGMMCPPLSLLGIAMAVAFRLGRGPRTALGLQYARWAVAVGLLSLAAGGGLYLMAIRSAAGAAEAVREAGTEGANDAPSAEPVQGGEEG